MSILTGSNVAFDVLHMTIEEFLLIVENSFRTLFPWCEELREDVQDREGVDKVSAWDGCGCEFFEQRALEEYYPYQSRCCSNNGANMRLTIFATAGSVFRFARLLKAICIIRDPA